MTRRLANYTTDRLICAECARYCVHREVGFFHGAVAQLGERLNGIQEVRGSNPLSSTTGNQGGTAESPSPLWRGGFLFL
jgi:hypothetical protein